MEIPLASLTSSRATTTTTSLKLNGGLGRELCVSKKGTVKSGPNQMRWCVRASAERSRSNEDIKNSDNSRFTGSVMEVTTFDRGFGQPAASDFPVWDKIGAIVRLSYGIGIYGAMALAGRFICSITGVDSMGGFHPSLDAIVEGLGYAAPPIMALLFILDDEVVKLSPHARAIRDVEDEELRSFFYGMSPWQFVLIVAASSVGEELFYRAAVQGALADIFLRGTDFLTDAQGMASLTGVLPPFVPFAQAFAAVITAALTGSLYYVATSPKDPTYVVAPVLRSRSGREDLKKLFAGVSPDCTVTLMLKFIASASANSTSPAKAAFLQAAIISHLQLFAAMPNPATISDAEAWYERRQMKKIYSPLLEGLLALYLGFEWIQVRFMIIGEGCIRESSGLNWKEMTQIENEGAVMEECQRKSVHYC
ncbi:hypothetical protein KPL71_012076 [Citrus sinensis]|uniref:Uncharacterized protein n=1 Tax=Citrus sinensis TaxID=2711 RepID=A0ACB8L8Q6_CITSI|nr:hypothetical protein KPL71_012076 [Citrus sinensis]